eukprot:TRINITY_DN9968_c0_g1_i22.p1 TRINITY_DN9968_c0_g1~~TRINITY_DN9968_c0_g1_i22.p1  ORF type:complete len:229 (+),score=75.15 TRINITY_DN9968_c0_g1_i22:685-1371(+)
MRLAWFRRDRRVELETYDCIGLAYYYLGDINKAIYYHNRMMEKRLEGDSQEKRWNNQAVANKLEKNSYKRSLIQKSVFEEYKGHAKGSRKLFPHENIEYTIILQLKGRFPVNLKKVVSPKYENNNMRQQLLSQALRMSFLDGSILPSEYDSGRVPEENASHLGSLKPSTSPHIRSKVQVHANKLIKHKLRIFSLSKESRYGNAQKKMNTTCFARERPGTRLVDRLRFV